MSLRGGASEDSRVVASPDIVQFSFEDHNICVGQDYELRPGLEVPASVQDTHGDVSGHPCLRVSVFRSI